MKIHFIYTILIIVSLFAAYLFFKMNKKFRKKVYSLFLDAEQYFDIEEGEYKMDYVLENIYPYLPSFIRIFISKNSFQKIVQKIFNEVTFLLNDENLEKGDLDE